MEALENYFEKHQQPEYRLECSMTSDTLEALENAEKLVCEAKRTIVEAKSRVCLSDNIPENPEVIKLTDDLLEIKCIVAAKFDEANGNFGDKAQCKPMKSNECEKCLLEKKFGTMKTKKCRELNYFGNFSIQRGPKIDIRNDLAMSKVDKLEIPPHSSIPSSNTGNFQLRHEALKRGRIDDECSLIDAGVQTSLRDSLIGSKFDEPMAATSRSHCSDLDQNKIDGLNLARAGEIKDSTKIHECQGGQIIKDSIENNSGNVAQRNFMDFLMEIKSLEEEIEKTTLEKKGENLPNQHDNDNTSGILNFPFNLDAVSLKLPDIAHLDKIINKIDKKLKIVNELTDNLQLDMSHAVPVETNILKVNTHTVENKINDEENNIKILFNPRLRMSSTSSSSSTVSADLFQPSERFSTPRDNWKIDDLANVILQIDDETTRPIVVTTSEPIIKEPNNTFDGIIPITRNNLSTPLLSEKNTQQFNNSDKISTTVSSTLSYAKKTGDMAYKTDSLFPSYSSDKSENSLKIQRSLVLGKSQAKQTASDAISNKVSISEKINNKNITQITEECQTREVDLRGNEITSLTDNKVHRNSGNFLVVSEHSGNKENPVHTVLSTGDATSDDISKLSSEILGSSGGNKKSDSLNLHSGQQEKAICEIYTKNNNDEKSTRINNVTDICEVNFREKETMLSMTEKSLESHSTRNCQSKNVDSTGSSHLSNKMTKEHSTIELSEGELFLPTSCAYSLGEVVISEKGPQFPKICVNLSNHTSSQMEEVNCSPGEVSATDIDSDSSGFRRGHVA